MKYRRLGSTGIEVSELAFGTWGIGGLTAGQTSYGQTDDKISLRALRHALASGITLFDTSNVYGDGHSETLLGRAFHKDRNAVVIATKVGWPSYTAPSDFSSIGMRRSLEGSLRRLQTDHVDLLQLHNPPLNWLQVHSHILDTLLSFVAEGKVRALGVSVRSPDEARTLSDQPAIVAVQANFNLMDIRVVTSDLLTARFSRVRSTIARTPLCFGFLSGLIDRTTLFPEGDHRAAWPVAQRERWIQGSEILERMVLAHGEAPLFEAALRFCISFPNIAAVLAGMLNEAEVTKNVLAVNRGTLPNPLLVEILDLHKNMKFFASAPDEERAKASTLTKL